MKHLRIIIEREYLNKIRNKSFIIMTFVSPLIVVAFALIIGFLTDVNSKSNAKDILILDESGLFGTTFSDTETIHYEYLKDKTLQEARAEVLATSKYGLLYIPKEETAQKAFYSEESPSLSLVNELTGALEKTLFQYNLTQKGIDKAEIDSARTKITLQMENFTGEKTSEFDNVMKIAIGGVAGYLIFMFIIIYGNMIMRSVIEEKTNRIVEIIISSVKPFQLMLGKIIGTSLAGLTQFAIWLVIGGVLFALAPSLFQVDTPTATQAMAATESHSEISNIIAALYHFPFLETSGVFLLFFVGGYLLYSSLYAMVGAMVDNETDTQQFMMPILIPLMLAFYVGMFSVIEEPHGTISVVFSYIPLTSPVVMLMRIPFGVAWWEVLISLLLLYITFFLVIKIASKIYRIGILMYGKKPTYKEVWKWLKMN
ncbi:ABC transporter permease [Capnocytophaga leadbetteri]|uniref:ABC transporter permease n=1 Tax=Capnocytophaga leadbetteri TaxID=327575 RepID=UPI0028EDDF56|nr:ABC transporter permease [Capnocytophaga leadbetteri]